MSRSLLPPTSDELDDIAAVRALAAPFDPAPPQLDLEYDERAAETLERILTSGGRGSTKRSLGRTHRPRWSRRRFLVVVGSAALVALVSTTVLVTTGRGGAESAYAAVPSLLVYHQQPDAPTAAVLLRQLAARAAAQPPLPNGKYLFVESDAGVLKDLTEGHHRVGYAFQTEHDRMWVAADGSGRADYDVRPASYSTHKSFGPGGLSGWTEPTTVAALHHQHGLTNSQKDAPIWFWLYASGDMSTMTPQSQAAYLSLFASLPGVVNRGTVVDRAGRPGVAVSHDSLHDGGGPLDVRWTLIFDPTTGMPLAAEETLLNDHPGFPPAPVTLAYTTILKVTRTATTHTGDPAS